MGVRISPPLQLDNRDKERRMLKLRTFIQETYTELTTKVSWPTWSELQESAIVVMVASLIIGVVVYLIDLGFSGLLSVIYSM